MRLLSNIGANTASGSQPPSALRKRNRRGLAVLWASPARVAPKSAAATAADPRNVRRVVNMMASVKEMVRVGERCRHERDPGLAMPRDRLHVGPEIEHAD